MHVENSAASRFQYAPVGSSIEQGPNPQVGFYPVESQGRKQASSRLRAVPRLSEVAVTKRPRAALQSVDLIPADGPKSREPDARRDRAHVVLLPTFPMLRAGESHNRKKTRFLESSVFFRSGLTPLVFFREISRRRLQKTGFRLAFGLRQPCSRARLGPATSVASCSATHW